MNNWHKLLLRFITAIITFLLIYLLISSLIIKDFATSLEPGWHTTIYPFGGALSLTVVVLIFSLLTYLMFKYILRILTIIWLKIFSLHP